MQCKLIPSRAELPWPSSVLSGCAIACSIACELLPPLSPAPVLADSSPRKLNLLLSRTPMLPPPVGLGLRIFYPGPPSPPYSCSPLSTPDDCTTTPSSNSSARTALRFNFQGTGKPHSCRCCHFVSFQGDGEITAVELPLWLRSYVYSGWARAFHSNLDEASRPIEEYPSLRAFFTRKLKDGARPLEVGPSNLISPVDGVVIGCGQVKSPGTMIEQVKGFSYSLSALLGAPPQLSGAKVTKLGEGSQTLTTTAPPADPLILKGPSMSSPLDRSLKGLFYCVLYLGPGDYHRIHSPSDWKIRLRRHFAGKLFPVNDRAVRTVKNLYVVNERVVLEGEWSQGLMAMAAVGATNVGSIELALEPELKTNLPLLGQKAPFIVTTQKYGIGGEGVGVKAGDEVAVFNLGSTVVLVFEAPVADVDFANSSLQKEQFRFLLRKGQRVKMGEAIGKW